MAALELHIMKLCSGLENFLKDALAKSKRDRFVGLHSTSKGYMKFCKSLNHDLEKYLDPTKFVSRFLENDLEQRGDLICSNGDLNNSDESMLTLYGKAPWEGGWLLLNKSGTIAIYRPEGRIDDELYIKL